jgi:hypothetical protein
MSGWSTVYSVGTNSPSAVKSLLPMPRRPMCQLSSTATPVTGTNSIRFSGPPARIVDTATAGASAPTVLTGG